MLDKLSEERKKEYKESFEIYDTKKDGSISLSDYENVLKAGFKDVELVPIHEREYFKNRFLFKEFLKKVPIIDEFSEEDDAVDYYKKEINEELLDKYIKTHTYEKGILLIRRYYGIVAKKASTRLFFIK